MAETGVHPVREQARDLAESRPVNWAARLGLAARGGVYLLLGVLGLLLALGTRKAPADQRGAFAELVTHPYGVVLVALMAVGFAGYALWRLSEAAFGVTGQGRGAGPRLQSLARALAYAVLTASSVSVLAGSRTSQSSQQRDLTARMLQQPWGQPVLIVIGSAIVVIGGALVVQGVRAGFMRFFRGLPARRAAVIRPLGQFGTIARGVVFGVVGALLISAAASYDPNKSSGIDGALRTLLRQPYGRVLVILLSAGLISFGVYGLAEARYRRV